MTKVKWKVVTLMIMILSYKSVFNCNIEIKVVRLGA